MSSNLILALQITLIGMGLVFAAIILLWVLMALLVRLATEKTEELPEASLPTQSEMERKRKAAAIAVAIALAQYHDHSEPHEFPLPPTALVSAWQAVMRTRMVTKRGTKR